MSCRVYYAGALLYLVKQDPNCPVVTLERICEITKIRRSALGKMYRRICSEQEAHPYVCQVRPTIYVRTFGQQLELSQKTVDKAVELAKETVKHRLHFKSPLTLAAGILFLACNLTDERRTQKEIAEVCRISEPSLRKSFRLLTVSSIQL